MQADGPWRGTSSTKKERSINLDYKIWKNMVTSKDALII